MSAWLGCASAATAPPSAAAPGVESAPVAAAAAPSASAATPVNAESPAAPTTAPARVDAGVSDAAVAVTPAAAPVTEFPYADALLELPGSTSSSVGGPSSGHVLGAVPLPDSGPGFLHNAKRPSEARYGSIELVQAIARAAAVVDRELPGSVLVVNDLGLREGGRIRQHGSHQAGRDADILYYSLTPDGNPIPSVGVPLDPKGVGWDFKDLTVASDDERVKLDAPRTWRFVQALFEVAPELVQRIFMVEHVRTMLLAAAQKARAPKAIVQRFEDVTCQPETPHDDHFHLRLYCTPEDLGAGCEDSPPVYPWRTQLLAALGIKDVLASAYRTKAERDDVRARTTTPAQAKKRAGPMHPHVLAFLAQRAKWIKRPHPGRVYCK